MALPDQRWHTSGLSEFPWEQEALDYLRRELPDESPWAVWPNFEFVASSGALYEVDALVLSRKGLWLVEIKSQPGTVTGDTHTLVFTEGERRTVIDNPVFLTNRKAKALKGKLQRVVPRHVWLPRVEPLVFLSHPQLKSKLKDEATAWICGRNRSGPASSISGVVEAMTTGLVQGTSLDGRREVDLTEVGALIRAIDQVVRPASVGLSLGDYRLEEALGEGPGRQDWVARHATVESSYRRARCYLVAQGAGKEERERIQRAAEREFRLLDSSAVPGMLPVKHFTSWDLGPVLLFEHDPRSVRLDHWRKQHADLPWHAAVKVVAEIAEIVSRAHEQGLIHRALSPLSVLITPRSDDDDAPGRVQVFNWQTALRVDDVAKPGEVSGTISVKELVQDRASAYLAPEAVVSPLEANEVSDIFSLGAVAYFALRGKPAARNHVHLLEVLGKEGGLRLSRSLKDIPKAVDDLVFFATQSDPELRWSLADFRSQLEEATAELNESS